MTPKFISVKDVGELLHAYLPNADPAKVLVFLHAIGDRCSDPRAVKYLRRVADDFHDAIRSAPTKKGKTK